MHTCNLCVHLYLLVIAVVSLHLVAICIDLTFMPITLLTLSETKCFSFVYNNVGSISHYSSSTVENKSAIWQPYLFSDIC